MPLSKEAKKARRKACDDLAYEFYFRRKEVLGNNNKLLQKLAYSLTKSFLEEKQ